MKLGVVIAEGVEPSFPSTFAALEAWIARTGRPPDLFPLWCKFRAQPYPHWDLDTRLLVAIRHLGIEPVVYMDSHGASYPDILAGRYDDALRLISCKADGCVIRWDPEPNGHWGAPWQNETPDAYKDVWWHVSPLLRSEGDVRMFWCAVGRSGSGGDMADYWTGSDSTQIIGFDRYSRDEYGRFPPAQWADPIAWCRRTSPSLPVWVGECGRERGLTRRGEWLASIADAGADAAIVMDMLVDLPELGILDDWRWNRAMDRAWATMGS